MAETVPVRCPMCRRAHHYVPPVHWCPCGAPVTPPLLRGGVPVRIHHRVWADSWLTLRCAACGRCDEWPRPELGCPCGVLLWLPLVHDHSHPAAVSLTGTTASALAPPGSVPPDSVAPDGVAPDGVAPDGAIADGAAPDMVWRRPAFQPVTIRTAQDVVAAAARYLDWLGFQQVRTTAGARPVPGVDLRGPAVLARVDPTTAPTPLDAVETLWLHGLNESAVAVCFSLAGYAPDARRRADDLRLPLFVLDLTGTPQPVNDAARELARRGGTY